MAIFQTLSLLCLPAITLPTLPSVPLDIIQILVPSFLLGILTAYLIDYLLFPAPDRDLYAQLMDLRRRVRETEQMQTQHSETEKTTGRTSEMKKELGIEGAKKKLEECRDARHDIRNNWKGIRKETREILGLNKPEGEGEGEAEAEGEQEQCVFCGSKTRYGEAKYRRVMSRSRSCF